MLTNSDVHKFCIGYHGQKQRITRAICTRAHCTQLMKHNIEYNEATMGSLTLADRLYRTAEKCKGVTRKKRRHDLFFSKEFELVVLPQSAPHTPTAAQHATQLHSTKSLKRKVVNRSDRRQC